MKKYLSFTFFLSGLLILYSMTGLTVSRYTLAAAVRNNYLAENPFFKKKISVTGYFKALDRLPDIAAPFLCRMDEQKIYSYLGRTFLKKAEGITDKSSPDYFENLEHAEKYYRKSSRLNPLDIGSAKGLAQTVFLLEKSSKTTVNALPFFERLRELGPNIVKNQYLIADYFYYRDMKKALFKTIEHLAAIYPSDYGKLKKKNFYSLTVRPYIRKGLETAIDQNIQPKRAYFSMGQFFKDDGNIPEAVEYYGRGMKIRPYENAEHQYLSFGRLLLADKKFDRAFKEFEIVLVYTTHKKKILNQIYHSFQRDKLYNEFLNFSRQVESNRGVIKDLGIFIVRARIELGLFELAKARLIQLNSERESAEAFYLLSVIAEKEKNWDAMEINIQKAVILDPTNCHYYNRFARSLRLQGKYTQAKIQQDKARQCAKSKKS